MAIRAVCLVCCFSACFTIIKIQTLQIGILLLIGILALSIGVYLGSQTDWLSLLDTNTGLLSMLSAVSFLRLIAINNDASVTEIPHGMGHIVKP